MFLYLFNFQLLHVKSWILKKNSPTFTLVIDASSEAVDNILS